MGIDSRPDVECPDCGGSGFIAKLYPSGHTEERCDLCDGSGEVSWSYYEYINSKRRSFNELLGEL